MDGAYAEIGPLAVRLEEFTKLRDHTNIFCKGENAVELLFVVTGTIRTIEERILGDKIVLVPTVYSDNQHASFHSSLLEKVSRVAGLLAVGHVHTNGSVEPSHEDVATSVLIDRKIGRALYHIIMNEETEFEVYSNGEHLRNLHKPVVDNPPETVTRGDSG